MNRVGVRYRDGGVHTALAALGLALCAGWYWNYFSDTEIARRDFVFAQDRQAEQVAVQLSHAFRDIYQALRTAARLPGVRAVERHAQGFDANAHQVLQDLYNNLATNVSVSEVYLIPADFDPDAIDPFTGRFQEAILEYDELIAGRFAGRKSPAGTEIEEIEIHEWRLMRDQARWFNENYPTLDEIDGAVYPAVGGPEVVTCDNTRLVAQQIQDKDRSGLVYSVPYYGLDGRLAGVVSAVILTLALADLLPGDGRYALFNPDHDYVITSKQNGQARISRDWVNRGLPDPALMHSRVIHIGNVDRGNGWQLWAGSSNEGFDSSSEQAVNRRLLTFGLVSSLVSVLALSSIIRRRRRETERLEKTVFERTQALARANSDLEQARDSERRFTGDAAHELRTPLAALKAQAQVAQRAIRPDARARALERVVGEVDRSARLVDQMLALARVDPITVLDAPYPVSLLEIAEETVVELAPQARQMQIEVMLDAHPTPRLSARPELLHLLVRNLLDNAIRYTPANGRVRVRIAASGGGTLLEIEDSGPGIPPRSRSQVFDRFSRLPGTKKEGSGLGLSIVKRVAKLHRATVGIETSADLGGALVWVRFPGCSPQPPAPE